MLCNNPYVKTQTGISRLKAVMSTDAKTAVTPFPCGRCLHCKINKSREWTNRLLLENMCSSFSSFLTLTYNDDHIPDNGNLEPVHLRNFIQTLRRKTHENQKLRYFAVGEYGETTWRPHYHVALFSNDWLSPLQISGSWSKGFLHQGELTKESARYITGYITKKITKPYYEHLGDRLPEFMRCSKKGGGIGYGAIQQIAKKLKCDKHFKPRIIRELKVGKSCLPLGRYLTEKLSVALGITESQKSLDLYEYQMKFIDKYIDSPNFLGALLDDTLGKRHSKEYKFNIYKKGKTL